MTAPAPELAVVYAALVLHDDQIPLSGDKIRTLLSVAGVNVDAFWVDLFVEYFKNHSLASLLTGTALGGAGGPSSGPAASGGAAPAAEEKKEEKKEEEAVVELAGGFDDLFG
jgi:large subunit ribosomal protein LP1